MNKKKGWTCVYLPCLYLYKQKRKEKQKRTFFFAPNRIESNGIFIRENHFFFLSFCYLSITTYSVPHTFSVDISSSVQTKKTPGSCLLPLAIARQGG